MNTRSNTSFTLASILLKVKMWNYVECQVCSIWILLRRKVAKISLRRWNIIELKNLYEVVDPELDLDQEILRQFLEQRLERLETFFDKVYPEFNYGNGGVFNFGRCIRTNCVGMSWCEQHVTHGNLNHRLSIDREGVFMLPKLKMLYSVYRATRREGDSNIGTTNTVDTLGRGIISKIWNH